MLKLIQVKTPPGLKDYVWVNGALVSLEDANSGETITLLRTDWLDLGRWGLKEMATEMVDPLCPALRG